MRSTHGFWPTILLSALAGIALTGCGTQFVQDSARDSLSSFVIDVFTTAVNETVSSGD